MWHVILPFGAQKFSIVSINCLVRIYNCLLYNCFVSQCVIGQFDSSILSPSIWHKGMLVIESEYKNISIWYKFFHSWSNHTKLLWWLGCCALNQNKTAKIVTSLLRNLTWNSSVQNQFWGFLMLSLPQRHFMGKHTKWSSRWVHLTKQINLKKYIFWHLWLVSLLEWVTCTILLLRTNFKHFWLLLGKFHYTFSFSTKKMCVDGT